MSRTMKILAIWIAVISSERGFSEEKRDVVVGTLASPASILPLLQYPSDTPSIRFLLNPPILTIQADGRIDCWLCKEPPTIELVKEDEKRGRELAVSIVLKKQLKWADGSDLTRDDIKFTLETMSQAPYPRGQGPILPIRFIRYDSDNPNKLTLILRHRRPDASRIFAISLLPKHKSDAIQGLLKNLKDTQILLGGMLDSGFFYGPFKVGKIEGTTIKLIRNNSNDWENSPTKDLFVRFFGDTKELALAMQSGTIDQTFNGDLTWDQYQTLLKLTPDLASKYQPVYRPGDTLETIVLNLRSPLLMNPQLRLALFHGINRQLINDTLYGKNASTTDGLYNSTISQRFSEKSPVVYQPQLAAQLLEQAGYHLAKDGFRYSDDNKKLSLTLSCSEARLRIPYDQLIQKELRTLGIEMKIDLLDNSEYSRLTVPHRRFKDLACMRWVLPPLSPPIQIFHSLAIPDNENSYIGENFSSWEQTSVNKILESMMMEYKPALLIRLFNRLEKQFITEVPAIPLVYLPTVGLQRRLNNDVESEQNIRDLATFTSGIRNKKL